MFKNYSLKKNNKPPSYSAIALREDLKAAAEEVRLHKQGKLKLKTAKDLLNEL